MKWAALVPELSVSDLQVSLAFYARCGFSVRFQRHDPPFAYVELGEAQLMLEEDSGWATGPLERPLGRGVNFQIEVPDLSAVLSGLAGLPLFREPVEHWYAVGNGAEEGQREFLVQDPDGYLLRFCEPLGSRAGPLH